ncbi:uncharacterized protein [Littorina saxatilis]|uniref:uncharacterized protein n=1 Tax=Littorina saxatilis TaxID=31220 RepID=UPI0038B5B0C9
MSTILSRIRVTGANFLTWCREFLLGLHSDSVIVETDEDLKTLRTVRVNSFMHTGLKLQSHDEGQLTEENVADFFDAHSHTNTVSVISITITQHPELTDIPTSIGKFVSLTSLDLSSNSLKDLPLSVVYLQAVKVLNLSGNQFCTIPPIIGHLTRLEQLILKDNDLQYLPTSLVHLKRLRVLDVSGNDMMFAPPLKVCRKGTGAIMKHLRKRIGRSNLWSSHRQYYTETAMDACRGNFEMKSLLEICVATVLKFRIDYFSQAHIAPSLKRHLHDRTQAELAAVKISKCSKCKMFFSSQANFDDHDCDMYTFL